MIRPVLSILLYSLLSALPVNAQTFMSEEGRAEFTSRVPLHTFTGTSKNLTGQIDLVESTVDFYIDLTTLKTGNKKRDKDMLLTLETKEFPFAEFFGKLETPFDPTKPGVQPVKVRGDFKIHGVTREIEVEGTMQSSSQGLVVNAAWELNLKDYKIVPPSLLIMKVDEVQEVKIEAMLIPVTN